MILNLKYLVFSLLLSICFTTTEINKDVVLDKLETFVDSSKLDQSTFMQIEELINESVEKVFPEQNTGQGGTTVKPNESRSRFNSDTFSDNIDVSNGCSGDDMHVVGKVQVTNMLNTTFFNTENLKLKELFVKSIYNPHSPIVMRGNIKMSTVTTLEPVQATSFLVKDVQQWTLLKHESFNANDQIEGWSFAQVGSCQNSQLKNSFLGGPCLLNTEVTKRFENLPPHNKLRIKATVHLFDNWEGETLFLEVDGGKMVWSKKGVINTKFETPDRCGSPEYGDPLMNLNIDKIMNHEDSFLTLRFSTNMNNKDSCKASYGIDDISVYFQ